MNHAAPSLAGRVALVTGASSGIGRATAIEFVRRGAKVAVSARRADRLKELAAELGDAALALPADLTAPGQAEETVRRTLGGLGRLDILVNNAGYATNGLVEDGDPAVWDTVVDINLRAVMTLSRAALPHLLAAAGGPAGVADLVTVSSVVGRRASAGNAPYAATKHAVIAFSEVMRQEVAARRVRVGVIEPGMVATEMTLGTGIGGELGTSADDWLREQDLAEAIAFMVTRPKQAAISEILMRPTTQEF
ncbi:SDR family oxidoreductase [Streptomyces sp. NPDC058382]|uniref:SDR family oxidoreductase n=1 Tax=unclassified Streptomyces TaxID=2593676 RepID=UPI003644898D